MKLKDMTVDELEVMGYVNIAYKILEETKKKMKVTDLFRRICDLLGLSEADYENQIADFFELLTTDKKFIMLDNGYWDLRTRHSEKMVVEDDDEEFEEEVEDPATEEEIEEDIDNYYDENSDDDTTEDDLKDFVVIDEDEEN